MIQLFTMFMKTSQLVHNYFLKQFLLAGLAKA